MKRIPGDAEFWLSAIIDRAGAVPGEMVHFPFTHRYEEQAGVMEVAARCILEPDGYLSVDASGQYSITMQGFRLIRWMLPEELRQQGDDYYREAIS